MSLQSMRRSFEKQWNGSEWEIRSDGGSKVVAVVPDSERMRGVFPTEQDQIAQLFAKSPELYSLLRSLVTRFERDDIPKRHEKRASGLEGVNVFITYGEITHVRDVLSSAVEK